MRRRFVVAGAALAATLLATTFGVTAAAAAPARSGTGWVPTPSGPWDPAAGVVCDFAVYGENLVDEVERLVIQTHPDGTVKRDPFKGALIIRLTGTTNGRFSDADASGAAMVDHHPDGSLSWLVIGPALARIPTGRSNLRRGLYVLDGVYHVDIHAAGFITITFVAGSAVDVCPSLA